jgi:hypothetical protein
MPKIIAENLLKKHHTKRSFPLSAFKFLTAKTAYVQLQPFREWTSYSKSGSPDRLMTSFPKCDVFKWFMHITIPSLYPHQKWP